MKLGECKVTRAHGRPNGETTSRAMTPGEIAALADATGELRRNGTQWASEYGQTPGWRYVVADVDPDAWDEPSASPKVINRSAFDAGRAAALRGCLRLLTCANSDQERSEWYRGWDSVVEENRGKWPLTGPVPAALKHLASDEEIDEPAFNPNTSPKDTSGRPLTPGDYEVRRGGQVQLATVFEAEDCELMVRFAGSDRTQRVDECARHLSWQRITASDVR